MKRNRIIMGSFGIVLLFLTVIGCSQEAEPSGGEKIAYISVVENSQYEKTFKDLNLGTLFDYHLRLPQADKTWITVWIEGYTNGEKMEPFLLDELSYGLYPNQVVEGPLGFGIINPQSEKPQFFMYSSGTSIPPHEIDNILNREDKVASAWAYAIDKKEVSLESGETQVLGVYREVNKNAIRPYDYQDAQQIAEMINEDMTVLLLKIKVELRK